MTESRIDYVVLSPELQQGDPRRFTSLFTGFAAGYALHFSGDEAESTDEWLARIRGKHPPQPLMRIVVAVETLDNSGDPARERVIGGLACELYRDSGCVLATYLYVLDDPSHRYRHQHHARALIGQIPDAFGPLGRDVRAVLAESECPQSLKAQGHPDRNVATARNRLRFFARLDARVFNIDYVQPSLGTTKAPVSYLQLMWIPTSETTRRPADHLLAPIAASFLTEFYAALSQETAVPLDHRALERQHVQLETQRPLTRPLPRLALEDAALCFHFVEHLDESEDTRALLNGVRNSDTPDTQCPVFHSMETDLLSRAYRTSRPFRTMCLTKRAATAIPPSDASIRVTITFPERIEFRSENRAEERRWPLRERAARAYLALSFFFDASLIVWHLTLTSDAEAPEAHRFFDEVDLVALLKLADDDADQEFLRVRAHGSEERSPITAGITFRIAEGDGTELDINGLLRTAAAITFRRLNDGIPPRRASRPQAATVELLGWDHIDSERDYFGVDDRRTREALCGIVTAIFDFDAIDEAEVRDTLTASVAVKAGLLRIHRQHLVYIGKDDRAARTVAGSFGISPYLVIPHATVLCNEALLRPFEPPARAGRDERSLSKLSAMVERIESALRSKWIANPFFYDTEQELYDQAMTEGGITARRARVENLLLELKTRLQMLRDVQRGRFEAFAAGVLGAISVVGLDAVMIDAAPWLRRHFSPFAGFDEKLLGHAVTLGMAVMVGAAVFYWKRPDQDIRLRVRKAEP